MALPVPEMRERLEETVHSLKLEKLLNRSLFALSGGEKQKIACASADAIHPDIFVLDEPSSNLDIATIEDLIGVIRHWQSEKKTVIVAEHRLYYRSLRRSNSLHDARKYYAGVYQSRVSKITA